MPPSILGSALILLAEIDPISFGFNFLFFSCGVVSLISLLFGFNCVVYGLDFTACRGVFNVLLFFRSVKLLLLAILL